MAEKDGVANKTPELSGGQKFKLFLWNPRTNEFLGRTGISWAKITIFYIIFYICLAAFWALMLFIFYRTLNDEEPKWKLDESRIGKNPGLGFRPNQPKSNVDSTLIWFTATTERGDWDYWEKDLTNFLSPYKKATSGTGEYQLGPSECNEGKQPDDKKYCPFNIRPLSTTNCTSDNNFGYHLGAPCVLIKLNRIYGWRPEAYEGNLPEKMPAKLKQDYQVDQVYITCEGENPADIENIGPLSYYPQQGIKNNYFPFQNQPGYLSPFVFVHFAKPQRGVLINVECKAWAKNIVHDRMDREGSVHFELLID